jgi:hypothetical protein
MMDRKSQFRFLTRHFFDRFFDKDSVAADADPRANVYPTLGLLAQPGLIAGFFGALSPQFAIFYPMIVMGFLMVYKWDSLFPDRRDYLILGSLPISYRDLFLAKTAALGLFLGMFALSTNFFIVLLAPLGRNGSIWADLSAHLAGIFGGALFMILGFAALQGVLISVLPQQSFRRISPFVQMLSTAILLTIFLAMPLVGESLSWLAQQGIQAIEYFPFFWFLGVYVLGSDDPDPIVRRLALNALYGLLVVAGTTVVTYTIAYRRHARSVLDALDAYPSAEDSWRHRLIRRADNVVVRHPVQRGCFRFIGSILLRSTRHQVFLAVYFAVGLALGVVPILSGRYEIVPEGILGLPLTLAFFVVSGLRAVFNIPYELPGNWIFRLTEAHDSEAYVTATRKWVAVYGIAPLLLLAAILEFAYWPWQTAIFHLAFEAMVSLLQLMFFNFRKVPFTCSPYPGKRNMVILAAIYLYGFTTYRSSMLALEYWLSESPLRGLFFFIGGIVLLIAIWSARRRRNTARLIYEEQADEQFQSLGLN